MFWLSIGFTLGFIIGVTLCAILADNIVSENKRLKELNDELKAVSQELYKSRRKENSHIRIVK